MAVSSISISLSSSSFSQGTNPSVGVALNATYSTPQIWPIGADLYLYTASSGGTSLGTIGYVEAAYFDELGIPKITTLSLSGFAPGTYYVGGTATVDGVTSSRSAITISGASAYIVFALNGGSGTMSSINSTVGNTVNLPTYSGTKTGYTFSGWRDQNNNYYPNGGSLYVELTTYTLTAQWAAANYTITYDSNGGTLNTSNLPSSYTINSSTITFGNPTSASRTGHTFNGWSPTSIASGSTGNKTVVAQWTADTYSITRYINGSGTNYNVTYGSTYGSTVLPSSITPPSGYTFSGWYNYTRSGWVNSSSTVSDGGDVYAIFSARSYSITYSTEGSTAFPVSGSHSNPSSYTVESGLITFSQGTLSRTGWTWNGWSPSSIASGSTGNKSITAQWTANTYSITSTYSIISSDYTSADVNGSSTTKSLATPTRAGYTFASYTLNGGSASISGSTLTINSGSTGNITIGATWTANTYSIDYVLNDGTNNASNVSSYVTDAAVTLYAPTRTNYEFNGWFDNAEFTGTAITSFSGTYGNKTFYAKWAALAGAITYSTGGSAAFPVSGSHGNPDIYTYGDSLTFVIGSMVRPGWKTPVFTPAGIAPSTTGAVNATVSWTAESYTISLNNNSGTGIAISNNTYTSANVNGSSITRTITRPTRLGHTFSSYSITRTGTNGGLAPTISVNTLTIPSGSYGGITITANWTANSNPITFNSHGSVVNDSWNTSTSAQTKEFTSAARTGYRATGASIGTNSLGSSSTLTVVGANVTANIPAGAYNSLIITASYTANTYTIAFNSNGGSAVSNKAATYDVAIGTLTTPTRAGYNFNGWYNSDFTIQYSAASINLTATHESTVIMYASWTPRTLTINYANGGGTGTMPSSSGFYDGEVLVKANGFTRTGYTFTGWLNSDALATTVNPTANTNYSVNNLSSTIDDAGVTSATITLTAQWQINQYTITFIANGGTATAAKTQDYNSSVTQPTNPTRPGYSFGGWFTEIELSNVQTWPFNMPVDGKTLYAKWNGNSYNISINSNGGIVSEAIIYSTGPNSQDVILPTLTKTVVGKKHSFHSWEIQSGDETASIVNVNRLRIPADVYGNFTVRVRWTVAVRLQRVNTVRMEANKIKVNNASVDKIIYVDGDMNEQILFENTEVLEANES